MRFNEPGSGAVRRELDAINQKSEHIPTKKHSSRFLKRLLICYKLKKRAKNR